MYELNGNNLISVDEDEIIREEVKKATNIQKAARYTWMLIFASSFVIWFNGHFWWGTAVFLGSIIIYGLGEEPEEKARVKLKMLKEDKLNNLLEIRGLSCSQKYITVNDLAVVVDENNCRICFIDYEVREFNYDDILEVEIIEDEVQITKTSRGSQLGGAIIGGALAGGIGAMIGGTTGQTTTSNEKVRKIYLKLIVNDTQRPFITIDFLNEKKELLKKEKKVIQATNMANHWYGLLTILMKRAG